MNTSAAVPVPAGAAAPAAVEAPVLVAGGISDSHTWNLVFLQLLLEEHGHTVVNLGPCVPEELLISEALARRPALIVISSVNGHGYQDGMRTITRLREHPGLGGLPVVIGGKLGISGTLSAAERTRLRGAGYTAVFDDTPEGVRSFARLLGTLPQRALV
ncbi:cobalamin B12-binding domain-containing protein [Streptomyces sp. NA02950]|uniref:cobalamin B12-binding domain-containing protein n=1 Tax=Streptomyces sp. NA02950 TaxID=2742137 RepID=UPI001591D590|nr:cobalamin-dependent protein [Streptomyces sp. NA02950]QKV96581.1 cobalamin B12-binding domain-containing protein [Streptomyces sp. NA02950]